ncbi:F-box protein-like protein [Tanacetum coccineum]
MKLRTKKKTISVCYQIVYLLISFLVYLRQNTLSKRWQHLWPYVSNLIFIFYMTSLEEWNHQRLSDIVSSIDKTLTQCHQFNLTKFKLRTPYDVIFESNVNNWIRYAFSCNAQDLELSILNNHSESEFVLDEFFFINSSFTRLRLDGCVFNLAGVISWKNLTSLVIFQGGLDDGLIKNIISGSPLLETLELYHCYGFGRIDITSKSVKKLMIGGYNDLERSMGSFRNCRNKCASYLVTSNHNVLFVMEGRVAKCTLSRLEAKGFTFPSNLEHPDWPDYDYDSSGSED